MVRASLYSVSIISQKWSRMHEEANKLIKTKNKTRTPRKRLL